MRRRDLLKALGALALSPLFGPFEALAAPARGLVKITAIKAMRLKEGGPSSGSIPMRASAAMANAVPTALPRAR